VIWRLILQVNTKCSDIREHSTQDVDGKMFGREESGSCADGIK
jgi:hypothetical protein